jgi:hypothetical protein
MLNVLSGVEAINISVLDVSIASTGRTILALIWISVFERYTFIVQELRCVVTLANELQSIVGLHDSFIFDVHSTLTYSYLRRMSYSTLLGEQHSVYIYSQFHT